MLASSLKGYTEYDTPDYDYANLEWSYENETADCGIVKYYNDNKQIYIFEGPDELLKISPEYQGKMGFICEVD